MERTNLAAVITTLLAATAPAISSATPLTDPIFSLGLLGSYSQLEFTGRRSTQTEHMPEGGLFLNYGNKMTGREGLVYLAEINGQYSEKENQKVKDSQADLDLGWRFALNSQDFLDVLLGAGYKWNRFEPHSNKYSVELTSRTPFAKAAVGYNHLFSDSTLRIEAGIRKMINGESQLKLGGVSDDTVDLSDSTNPYVELSYMFNQQGSYPLFASLYYNHFKYDLDGQFLLSNFDKQTRDEYGAKIGLVF
jgi:hypothetical protein